MEDNKPIVFDKGLQEALENPFKRRPKLQKMYSILQEDMDEMDQSFGIVPICSVLWYVCTKDRACFDFAMEFLGENIDIDRIPRLTSDQTYETLSYLGEDNASFLLSKIVCKDGVYTELIESLKQKNEQRFVAAISECDSSNINPTLKIVSIILDFLEMIEDAYDKGVENDLDESQFDSYLRYKVENWLKKLASLFDNEDSKKSFLAGADYAKTASDFGFFYCLIYSSYYGMKSRGVLDLEALGVLEYVLRQPPYSDDYLWCQSCFKYGTIEEGLEKCASRYPFMVKLLNDKFGLNISCSTRGWQLPDDFFTESYIDTCSVNDYFPMFMEHKIKLSRAGKEKLSKVKKPYRLLFEGFINWLAIEGYIDNTSITKSSFAHALTGRKVDGETIQVTWKRAHNGAPKQNNWTNNISYMIRELYPYRITDEKCNTIRKYDHLLKVFLFEAGNTKVSVGSSRAKYVDGVFKDKVDEFVLDVDLLAKAYGIFPK